MPYPEIMGAYSRDMRKEREARRWEKVGEWMQERRKTCIQQSTLHGWGDGRFALRHVAISAYRRDAPCHFNLAVCPEVVFKGIR